MAVPNPLEPGVIKFYNARAPTYDSETNSWHLSLASKFITWVTPFLPYPPPSSSSPLYMLDLCCGTGMVSAAAITAFGAANVVVDGVDVSATSLEIARVKMKGLGSKARFLEHSVLDLEELGAREGQEGLRKGGYGLIVCCSAFVLLPGSYEDVLRKWGEYLAPGGVMILDVPAPESMIPGLLFVRAVEGYGLPVVAREVFQDREEKLMSLIEAAGLVVKWWETDIMKVTEERTEDWEKAWEKFLKIPMPDMSVLTQSQTEEAKQKFGNLWRTRANAAGGVIKDETRLVIGIAGKGV